LIYKETPISEGLPSDNVLKNNLKNAKPEDFQDISVAHVDEKGRTMSEKEAWRHHSHRFHNKPSKPKKLAKHEKKMQGKLLIAKAIMSDNYQLPSDKVISKQQKISGEAGVLFEPIQVAMEAKRMKVIQKK
jgi:hypothetical protein